MNQKIKTMANEDNIYRDRIAKIRKAYQDSGDWAEVFHSAVYSDCIVSQEAFIDYLEEVSQTKVTDVKHLQKLTGITHLLSSDKVEAKNEAQAKQFAVKELSEVITIAKYSKYSRALTTALEGGAKYSDLLKMKPADWGLPEGWSAWHDILSSDQHKEILKAISTVFLIGEPLRYMVAPNLRTIADELEAPYPVILEAKVLSDSFI